MYSYYQTKEIFHKLFILTFSTIQIILTILEIKILVKYIIWFCVLKQHYMLIITVIIILSDNKIKNIVARLIIKRKLIIMMTKYTMLIEENNIHLSKYNNG